MNVENTMICYECITFLKKYVVIYYYLQDDSPLFIRLLCSLKIPLNLTFNREKLEDNLVKIYFKLNLKCLQKMTLFYSKKTYHYCAPLMRWSLYKCKCLWDVGGKGRDSSFQEGVSYTYTLRVSYSKIFILHKKI